MSAALKALLAEVDPRLTLLREYGGGQGRTLCVADPDAREYVLRVLLTGEEAAEGALLTALRHPAVPAVQRVGRLADGRAYLLRDHVDGTPLAILPNAPDELRAVLRQLLEVLAYVHHRGVCHLDLKPANLLLDRAGRLHLLDFGLSVRRGELGRGGTPFFAAPELLLQTVPDHRADLFSVGAMVAHALWPHQIDAARFVDRFPATDFLTAAGIDVQQLPEPFGRFVAQCVARRPSGRFPDAEAALEFFGGGSGRPSVQLFSPDPVDVFGPELENAGGDGHDVVLRGAGAADRRAIAIHLAATVPGVTAIEDGEECLRLRRDGREGAGIDLPALAAERLVGHLRDAFGLEGTVAQQTADWLAGDDGTTITAVTATLRGLAEAGELLPAGTRWSWPAAHGGRLGAAGSPPAEDESLPLADRIRAAAAVGRVEQALAYWRRAAREGGAAELEARTALAEGLLGAGEPMRALPFCVDLPLLRVHALVDTGQFAAAAREFVQLEVVDSPRYRRVAAQLAMAGGDWQRGRDVLDRANATVEEKLTLAALHESAGDLEASDAVLRGFGDRLDPARQPFLCATMHTIRGHVARQRGRLDEVRDHFTAAGRLFESLGNVRHAASSYLNLGVVAKDAGEHQEAVERFREARTLYSHVGDEARAAIASANLGIAALARHDLPTARSMLADAGPLLLRLGDRAAGRLAMVMLARAHAEAGAVEEAHAALAAVGEPDTDRLRAEVERFHAALAVSPTKPDTTNDMADRHEGGPSRELFRTFLAVNRQLAQATELDRAMRYLLDAAVTLTAGRNGFLLVMRDDGVRREFQSGDAGPQGQAFSRSLAHRAIQQQRTMTGGDVLADRELAQMPSVQNLQVRSALCVPFHSAGGTTGAVYVEHPGRAGAFTDRDKEALEVLADQAAIAVDRMLREEARERELEERKQELTVVRRAVRRRDRRMIGESRAMQELQQQIDKLAPRDIAVLVHGETGTGKELVARALHDRSARPRGPFVAENCSALPAELMERELFGHVEGAFTGADRDRPGLFELANGGTLFLDEVGDMPAALQAKLLRALQEKSIRRVGGSATIELDVRLVTATHKDLRAMVEDGSFREDLFFRIAAIELTVPPLREREGDVELLADHFVKTHAEERGRSLRLAKTVRAALVDYPWPGNVRELEHVLARAVLLCDGEEIVDAQLPRVDERAPSARAPGGTAPDAVVTLKEAERRAIVAAMQACGGDKAKTARALEISRTALYDKLKRHGLG